ncbi:MAG: helix-turn-helix domain-containing protein [Lachnospiraceae bacterium]|nr:helix-turn-helix domain-containing protein [Lachnospiraceae bacterium]
MPDKKSPFLKIAFLTIDTLSTRQLLDYCFYLVLEGSLRILEKENTFYLGKSDIFLFEPRRKYQVSSAGNNVILSIVLDNHFVLKGNSQTLGHYICNSASDSARNYDPLRQLLSQIANTASDPSDQKGLHLTSQAYRLLYYLDTYHYEPYAEQLFYTGNDKSQDRMNRVLNYIHLHYASPISLQETAKIFHLSAPYLSSFFKQGMQENFNAYVNRIRLEHAVDELVYTNKSITSITFDNGFASMNALNKLFREKYQTTPREYRKAHQLERNGQPPSGAAEQEQELNSNELHSLLEDYMTPGDTYSSNIPFPSQKTIEAADMNASAPISPLWKQLVNGGPLRRFFHRNIERQMAQLQESAGFSYVRIEHVVDYGLFLSRTATGQPSYLFSAIDILIDSMRHNRMAPYLDLSIPRNQLEVSSGKLTFDLSQYLSFVDALIRRNSNVYGSKLLETWYYEITPHRDLSLGFAEDPDAFLLRFTKTYEIIKKYLPEAKVGGICHDALLSYGSYRAILKALSSQGIRPDFLSLGGFPYEPFQEISLDQGPQSVRGIHYTRDTSYALHKLWEFKQVLSSFYDPLPELHIAYLGPDCFHGHYLNDTCFQSTFLFHNTIDLLGEVELLGYYQLSDIGSKSGEPTDFPTLLDGRTGLFNNYGIRKPGAHVLDLFSKCPCNLIQKGNDYIILRDTTDRYMIGLCNYTYVSEYEGFFMHQEIPIADAYKIYESPQTKSVQLTLRNLAVGEYDVILYQINKKHGSILDEWARNGYWNQFSRDELDYMRNTLQPLKTHYLKSTSDGTMQFQLQLEPHEVLFIALQQH